MKLEILLAASAYAVSQTSLRPSVKKVGVNENYHTSVSCIYGHLIFEVQNSWPKPKLNEPEVVANLGDRWPKPTS